MKTTYLAVATTPSARSSFIAAGAFTPLRLWPHLPQFWGLSHQIHKETSNKGVSASHWTM